MSTPATVVFPQICDLLRNFAPPNLHVGGKYPTRNPVTALPLGTSALCWSSGMRAGQVFNLAFAWCLG